MLMCLLKPARGPMTLIRSSENLHQEAHQVMIQWNENVINNSYLQYYKILEAGNNVGGFIVGDSGVGYQVCERIWIEPANMRRGIGTRSFQLVGDKYPKAYLWVLCTPEWNVRTKPFYENLGFVQIGITREYSQWNGRYYQKKIRDRIPRAISEIGELHENQQRVIVEGRIQSLSQPRKVYSRKKEKELMVAEASLRNHTGAIMLVLWNDQIRQVDDDSNVRILEGYVKSYRDELQLSIGKWGSIIILL